MPLIIHKNKSPPPLRQAIGEKYCRFSTETFWRLVFSHEWFIIHLQRDEVELEMNSEPRVWEHQSPKCWVGELCSLPPHYCGILPHPYALKACLDFHRPIATMTWVYLGLSQRWHEYIYLAPHRGRARYCNAHVCLSVCLFVCVFVCPCFRKISMCNISAISQPIIMKLGIHITYGYTVTDKYFQNFRSKVKVVGRRKVKNVIWPYLGNEWS